MKLVGEYEFTERGVKIEGKINDSHIAEIRALFKPFKTIRLYRGDVESVSQVYHVPHTSYRQYIRKHVPDICVPERESEFVYLPKSVQNSIDFDLYYNCANTFTQNMGIQYNDGDGRQVMEQRRIFTYRQFRRSGAGQLLTNSAWVWGADERGNFDIEIFGLVNRHMMTVILSNATKLAKYIDTVLVRALDKSEEFTAEKMEERRLNRNPLSSMRFISQIF